MPFLHLFMFARLIAGLYLLMIFQTYHVLLQVLLTTFVSDAGSRPTFVSSAGSRPIFVSGAGPRPTFVSDAGCRPTFVLGAGSRPTFVKGAGLVFDSMSVATDSFDTYLYIQTILATRDTPCLVQGVFVV
jgi:hypothetical protein